MSGASSAAIKKPPPDASGDSGTPQPLPTVAYTPGNFALVNHGQTGLIVGGGDASPWMLGTDSNVYHYNNDFQLARTWLPEAGSTNTVSLAVSPEGTPWRIDNNHHVFERTGPGTWAQKGTLQAYEIAVGPNEDAWAISTTINQYGDYLIYHWTGSWGSPMPGAAQHVAVAPDASTAYVSNGGGYIYKWVSNAWQFFGSCARRLSDGAQMGTPILGAAANDTLWVLGCSGPTNNVWAWHRQNSFWENVPGNANSITVTADGTPWIADASHNLYEYVSSWQSVGPNGFSFVEEHPLGDGGVDINQIWAGEIHDVDARPASGAVTIAATSGGVWQNAFGWVPIGDVGAGVNAQAGPVNSVGTVTVKPSDPNTVVVGTGVSGKINGANAYGNGVWVTRNAGSRTVTWSPVPFFDINNQPIIPPPATIVKVRYSADGSKIYAITPKLLFVSTDDALSFKQASDAGCAPPSPQVLTELVVDPQNSNIAYTGVAGWGVYQSTYVPSSGHTTCSHGTQPQLANSATPDTITQVALAISNLSLLYAAFAGQNIPGDPGNDDFANIDATSTGAWGSAWSVVVPAFASWGLNSQNAYQPPQDPASYGNAHTWALGTDPSGTLLILGGQGLYRGISCGLSGCASFYQLINPNGGPFDTGHADYHAITWGTNGWVYVANDGGLFYSTDGGGTWRNQMNTFAVMNEMSVSVSVSNIVASAWDVGAHFSTNSGTTWAGDINISPTDGRQAVADPASLSHLFVCNAPSGGTITRYAWDALAADASTTSWIERDSTPAEEADPCIMAKGMYGDLFTTGAFSDQDTVFHSSNYGQSWSAYHSNLAVSAPWSLVVSNEYPKPTVYAISGNNNISVSVNDQQWNYPPVSMGSTWPAGYQFAGANHGARGGAAATVDWLTGDFYVVGQDSNYMNSRVYESPVGSYGASWTALAGTTPAAPGLAGMLKQDESVLTIAVDLT